MKTSTHFILLALCLLGFSPDKLFTSLDGVRAESGMSEDSQTSSTTNTTLSCTTPTGLYTSDITTTSAKLHWSSVYGATSYSVQIRLPYGDWTYLSGSPFMNTWVTVYNLSPGTTYEWRVRANCSYGEQSSWSYPVSFTTDGSSSCQAPYDLHTLNITQTSAKWDWTSVSGATSYDVQWRYPGGSWNTLVSDWPHSWVNVTGLNPGTTYEWRVRSECSYNNHSPWSEIESFTTLSGVVCHVPLDLYTSNISSTSAKFHWSSVSGAQSYSVQIRHPYGDWTYVAGSPSYDTWITVYNLEPETTYEWRVRANCGYGEHSSWSYPVSFTTHGTSSCEPPYNLQTLNITQTSAKWSWSHVSGATSYDIQWRYPGGTWYTLVSDWPHSWVNVTGLHPATTYEWRVRSECSYGTHSPWSAIESFTTLGGVFCDVPMDLHSSNITDHSAKLHWSSVSGAQSYSVQIRQLYGDWYYVSGSPSYDTWITAYNLHPNTTYEWRVRSNCDYGEHSDWPYPASFTTTGSVSCTAPNDLHTHNITETTAKWDWSPVSNAVSYTIQWRYPGGAWNTLVSSWPYSHVNVNGLHPNTTYEWRVRSNCSYGSHSPWSNVEVFTTLGFSCYPPENLYTTNITSTSATFTWSPVPGAHSYSVQIRISYGDWAYIDGSPFTSTSVTVDYLNPGTTYQWRVRANCGYGVKSFWSSPVSFTTEGTFACHPPEHLHTLNISHTTATWDWSPVSGATSYSVQWRYPGGEWNNLPGGPWTHTKLNIWGLQPGTTYEWRVRSNCSYAHHSEWSASAVFTTLGATCHKPTNLMTTNITDTSATFSWSPVSGAQSYSVQIRLPNGYWEYVPGSPFTDTSVTVDDLHPGTAYAWRVRANCGYGHQSSWSSAMEFTTTGMSSCIAPDSTYTTHITDNRARLNWTTVSGAISYTVQWRLPGGPWNTFPFYPWSGPYVDFAGLDPNTTYEWRVRTNCANGLVSLWSDIESFTTLGSGVGNDYCHDAIPLTVASTCVATTGSNENATYSIPEPQGNCSSGGYNDVWFKFTMPDVSYPNVTIRTIAGTLTDAVMEIYIGNSCNSMSYLICENDNDNGNGSPMPVINLIGGPGVKVWVRVWGNNGSIGTFDICVLDHESDDIIDVTDAIIVPTVGELPFEELSMAGDQFENDNVSLVAVSPNPARDFLQVKYQNTEEATVSGLALIDLSGKVVIRKSYQLADIEGVEFNEELDVSGLTPGMYLLQIATPAGIVTEKVFVTR